MAPLLIRRRRNRSPWRLASAQRLLGGILILTAFLLHLDGIVLEGNRDLPDPTPVKTLELFRNTNSSFWNSSVKLRYSAHSFRGRLRLPEDITTCHSILEKSAAAMSLDPAVLGSTVHSDQPGKPYLILHIGPSKTATTTLQKESVRMEEVLKQDNYVYLGRYAPATVRRPANIASLFVRDNCTSISETGKPLSQQACWKDRIQYIRDRYAANNQSIIISDESYSYARYMEAICSDISYIPTLRGAFELDWNWHVVVTYRRYDEWALSVAMETNQKFCHNAGRSEGQWIFQGGRACWSMFQLMDSQLFKQPADSMFYRNLDMTIPYWRQGGVPVHILRMHLSGNQKDLLASFYCDIVPNAHHSCQSRLALPAPRENPKSFMPLVYNDIVFEAARLRILDSETRGNATRQEFTAQLAAYGDSLGLSFLDLPLDCPDKQWLNVLLQKSLQFERAIFPDETNAATEEEHRQSFWKTALEDKIYCTFNPHVVLHGKQSWNDVLDHLRQFVSH